MLWVTIPLNMKSFVYKIWIINSQGCCFVDLPELQIVLTNSKETREANCKVYDWKKQQKRLMICEPTIAATNLTIVARGADNLTLCEVVVTSAGIFLLKFNFTVSSFPVSSLFVCLETGSVTYLLLLYCESSNRKHHHLLVSLDDTFSKFKLLSS